MPDVLISPNHRISDFGGTPSLEQKITIFEDRVNGWFLGIAERLIVLDGDDAEFRPTDFAVLAILAVYFEMIAQYYSGRNSERASQERFCEGIDLVFPGQFTVDQRRKVYKSLRCALYHNGLTRGAIVGRERTEAFLFEDAFIRINPTSLLRDIRQHFTDYILSLRDSTSVDKRRNFETIYGANPKL